MRRSARAPSVSDPPDRATASAAPCYPARIEPPEYSESPARLVCCTAGAVVGLSAVPLVLLLSVEYTPPRLAFVVPGLALIVGSWLWDRRGRS